MIRKAKREGKDDVQYYLNIGAALPSTEQMQYYSTLSRTELLPIWKQYHSQHCLSYHMGPPLSPQQQQQAPNVGVPLSTMKCPRGRSCAFLHVDISNNNKNNNNTFQEQDECAG
jgi:hypothetical protein